jgi:hypothetical protein
MFDSHVLYAAKCTTTTTDHILHHNHRLRIDKEQARTCNRSFSIKPTTYQEAV